MRYTTTSVKGRKQEQIIRDLPAILSGRKADQYRLFSIFWSHVARSFLQSVYTAYEAKSLGGSDELGNRWKPLSPKTIAMRPITKEDRAQFGIGRLSGRGLLSSRENRRWKGIYASVFRRTKEELGEREASALAAKTAWGILKAQGARLRTEVLGSRNVLIMRLTQRLFRSLRPTTQIPYRPRADQIYDARNGSFQIGTSVPYAVDVAKDRPIFPAHMEPWIQKAIDSGIQAVLNRISTIR